MIETAGITPPSNEIRIVHHPLPNANWDVLAQGDHADRTVGFKRSVVPLHKSASSVRKPFTIQPIPVIRGGEAMHAAEKRRRLKTALAEAVSHPLRSRCLTILADRVASPSEIARELRVEVGNVGYHITALAEAGLIEEVGQRPVRGAVEHFYRAIVTPCVSDDEEEELDPAERDTFAETTISLFAANASNALEIGTLTERTDHHLTRVPIRVDEDGWKDLGHAYTELFERVYAIQEESAERLGKDADDPGISAISFLAFFEMPKARPDTKK